ncbi:MAG: hypothetical protein DHS20C01_30080 [marine bacterium B5-7]|nr:MAG: hypothetical protein DHS20C01_30080 [marine bacterium B5-7]
MRTTFSTLARLLGLRQPPPDPPRWQRLSDADPERCRTELAALPLNLTLPRGRCAPKGARTPLEQAQDERARLNLDLIGFETRGRI